MAEHVTLADGVNDARTKLSHAMGSALSTLLQTKHLYQKVTIEPSAIVASVAVYDPKERIRLPGVLKLDEMRFTPSDQILFSQDRDSGRPEVLPVLLIQNVKLFCSKCDETQVFACVWSVDVTNEVAKPIGWGRRSAASLPINTQLYVLAYQCQLCMSNIEVMTVRRAGWQLALEGRSPMERVQIPKYIPKPEAHLYRDAIVAIQAGKPLAALFYLRSFIEQFARRQTGIVGKATGEQIMTAYGQNLPLQHRDSMPSLGEWYEKLSDPIHAARDDTTVFEQALEKIEQHFDVRRVFKITDTRTVPEATTNDAN